MTKLNVYISLHRVKLAGIVAFVQGRLISQNMRDANGSLRWNAYRKDGYPCVVGAAVEDHAAHRMDRSIGEYMIADMVNDGRVALDHVTVSKEADLAVLTELQTLHDNGRNDELWAVLTKGYPYNVVGYIYSRYWKLRTKVLAFLNR
ncbi:hypothetical protein [Caulobacter phage KSC]|uniref:Uncharacterized protein n=1 Tax=Caulobacter phage KSC TaxID=3020398 RepID=A0AAF0B9Z4_9CAUD|nr:hypothetical protein [Caulobacter phage KSC]